MDSQADLDVNWLHNFVIKLFANGYCKCPKILYTKSSDKMAYTNSIDPDQTAPEGAI